jgi:hypothetical protein
VIFSRVEQAAGNNSLWFIAVCSARGAPGEFHKELWLNHRLVLRFYPNAITLLDRQADGVQLAHIQDLTGAGLPGGWGVKNSFGCLDLSSLGFRLSFDATWLSPPVWGREPG